MAKMSVADKVGQIIQADINSVTPEDVRTYHLGSILAGGDSGPNGKKYATPKQWQALADAYYKASTDTRDGNLGIPVLFGIDAVHGNNSTLGATLFPQHSALGATRDPALIREIGAATAAEVRASGIGWTFAPTITVPRDDRWGRTYEGYSENPQLVARFAAASVLGLQGKPGTSRFLDDTHVVATAKHYLGDGSTKNGKDQGDAEISEKQLIKVANAGYPPAISAGVQTVMASFSSWNGVKMTGNKMLLTDVLKDRMQFGGFVVGDWNAHGQVPGCSNVDCPQAVNAGLDMFMAPDSWKGLYQHTLAEVKSGVIPMKRLNDAVARILRVKFRAGLFNQGKPSSWPLARKSATVIGSPAHRALARRAVRESLVLLKNQNHLLPLDPHEHILVAGDGANNIPKQSGGWTLTWQGTGTTNANFPGATSIWKGIRDQVHAAGGTATLSAGGQYTHKPDVAIVVYGENPYAEFQGDVKNLAFHTGNVRTLKLLHRLHKAGIPTVSVFLSGRPLWVNPEINASNAFVAAWLPGSEGEGVADVLLRTPKGAIAHDFHGKLAYSWPRTAVQTPLNVGQKNYHPQFAYGYGLTYAENGNLPRVSERSGLKGPITSADTFFEHGKPVHGFQLQLVGADGVATSHPVAPVASADGSLRMLPVDHTAQENARLFEWRGNGAQVVVHADAPLDLDRQTNGDVLLVTTMRVDSVSSGRVSIGVECGTHCQARVPVDTQLAKLPKGKWLRVGVPLKCFRAAGAQMHTIDAPVIWTASAGTRLVISRVAIGTNVDRTLACPARKE